MSEYDLGIIGGMGPSATCELYKRLINNTLASKDQEHMKICILSNSKIPDRTDCILRDDDSPLIEINESIKDLKKIGCKRFVIPCNTAHYFEDMFKKNGLTFISMVNESLTYIKTNYSNKKLCVLGTSGTRKARVYERDNNTKIIYPKEEDQLIIMRIINDIKSGINVNKLVNEIKSIINKIMENNNIVFLLACTELSLFKDLLVDYIIVDAMDVLVKKTIEYCGYEIRK